MNDKNAFWIIYYWIMILLGLSSFPYFILERSFATLTEGEFSERLPAVYIFFVMTIIRFILMKKHFWNKP